MTEPVKRYRPGRTPTRILRNTEGDSYAIEAYSEPPPSDDFDPGYEGVLFCEYDDGNGMFVRLWPPHA